MAKKLPKKKSKTTKKEEPCKLKKYDWVTVKSLKFTKAKHGINTKMQRMVGKEYEVVETYESALNCYIQDSEGETWTFSSKDLELHTKAEDVCSEAMPNKPVMFDPAELM